MEYTVYFSIYRHPDARAEYGYVPVTADSPTDAAHKAAALFGYTVGPRFHIDGILDANTKEIPIKSLHF